MQNKNVLNDLQIKAVTELPNGHGYVFSFPAGWIRGARYPQAVLCAIGDLILIARPDAEQQIQNAVKVLKEYELFNIQDFERQKMEKVK